MKSEFMLAFNEIIEARGLPKDVVMEALRTALASAYRRNVGASSAQQVEAEVDAVSGQARIFVEKEVAESVQDDRTEVSLEKARESEPEAQVGDTVMVRVETTARGFGRIAAQTAKQVILQRIREAEREAQYEEYVEREGEIINGTVQSVTPSAVTIGLGRTEAILPRSQQVPGERYRPHDRVRAYVLEVRKTNRGPQIILSRSHRSMLRRLLEYEVPEIYNGQVEIKNIAREAGRRSKVAVVALQEGVDPVGACVGMRGVRIQSIVRELNDEKIDVIEWNPDQATFIAKALSPARVSGVYLDDDPGNGRTAIVIVPDDQLSLAIGREGQNARLAAKLTGWRIDIKSVIEASFGAMKHIRADDPALIELAQENAELVEEVGRILAKKEADRPVMPEEYKTLTRFAGMVEGRLVEARQAEREERRALLEEIRATVPAGAYQLSLEALGLEAGVEDALVKAGCQNVGALMEQIALDESRLASLEGVGAEAMEAVKASLETVEIPEVEVAEAEAPEEVEEAEEVVEAVEAVEAEPEAVISAAEEEVEAPTPPALPEAEVVPEPIPTTAPEPALAQGPAAPPEEYPFYEDQDRLEELEKAEVDKKRKREKERQRRRELVFDEALGEVVAKRRRKSSRESADWEPDELEEE